jgi:hypothetical protein
MSKLTPEEIYKLASEFWSDPEDIAQFTAMAMGESGGDVTDIAKPTYEEDGVTIENWGGDTGLWQIHPMHFDPDSPKYIKRDDKYQHDLVDLGIVSSHEAAQQELLDPRINALAAKAIARNNDFASGGLDDWDWGTDSLIVSDEKIDWDTFSPTTFYGRGNDNFGTWLGEAREFGQGYAASKVAGSMIAPTPTFAKGLEPAVRTIVGPDMPIGPGKIGRGEMSMLKKTLKGTIDFSSDIIEMLEKGLVAILPPEIISNIPKSALARVGLETDSKYPFFITPVGAKAFDIAGDIPGQLQGLIRSGISGIGNWFVEELGDGTNDPNV